MDAAAIAAAAGPETLADLALEKVEQGGDATTKSNFPATTFAISDFCNFADKRFWFFLPLTASISLMTSVASLLFRDAAKHSRRSPTLRVPEKRDRHRNLSATWEQSKPLSSVTSLCCRPTSSC